MEEKINVAEKLKDCAKGMPLDCTTFDTKVTYKGIIERIPGYPIVVQTEHGLEFELTQYGQLHNIVGAKCIIFPEGKTTWEGFVPPCKFKDGDVLSYQCVGFKNRTIYIYMRHSKMNTTYYVALSGSSDSEFMINNQEGHALNGHNDTVRHATEEEKQKLFKAIKDNGYKWNPETKTLERLDLPKTYYECCNILGANSLFVFKSIDEQEAVEHTKLIMLRHCRNAYWKLANDWKPDWIAKMDKYTITTWKGRISLDIGTHHNQFLVFPTKKMRDEFYSNFKSLIEECKEFL